MVIYTVIFKTQFQQALTVLQAYFIPLLSGLLIAVTLGGVIFFTPLGSGINASLNAAENVLLDMRLRLRANRFAPSSNIVLVTMDQKTEQYGQNHPESGLDNDFLPRDKLAKILEYIEKQHPKAIILDMYLKVPRDPAGDRTLAEVLHRHPNIILTTATTYSFETFANRYKAPLQDELALFRQYLVPFVLEHRQSLEAWVALDGFFPLFSSNQHLYQARQPLLSEWQLPPISTTLNQHQLAGIVSVPGRRPRLYDRVTSDTQKYWQLSEQGLYQDCAIQNYDLVYDHQPEILAQFLLHQLPLHLASLPSAKMQLANSYCYMAPIKPGFMGTNSTIGISKVSYDSQDTILRQVPLIYRGYQGAWFPYLGLTPLLTNGNRPSVVYLGDFLQINQQKLPLLNGSDLMVNWRNPSLLVQKMFLEQGKKASQDDLKQSFDYLGGGFLYRHVPAVDLLNQIEPLPSPDSNIGAHQYHLFNQPKSGIFSFKDKVVIYGESLKDLHPTPINEALPGSEIVACVVDMVMNDHQFITPLSLPKTLIWVFTWSLIILLCILRIPRVSVGYSIVFGILVLFTTLNFYLFTNQGLWVPLVGPLLWMVGLILLTSLMKYALQDKDKRELTQVFSKYVSPQVMETIIADPGKALETLKGSKQELTVLFSDIRNFTSTFETEDPEVMVEQLNEFFEVMTQIVLKHGGTHDKYMGDAIMAFFGAPLPLDNHALSAAKSALEMIEAQEILNDKWRKMGKLEIRQDIGLSSGMMYVGNFGSELQKNYTVMGSTVNLGARLVALAHQNMAQIILNQRAADLIANLAEITPLPPVMVKGFREPVSAYLLHALKKTKNIRDAR
ncbi:MAG: CHASE2 domain-containing protein [Cyanobacteria bacterium]|nr:CHASE2 domain-containing protein [Cyanobacteriota bacterium]